MQGRGTAALLLLTVAVLLFRPRSRLLRASYHYESTPTLVAPVRSPAPLPAPISTTATTSSMPASSKTRTAHDGRRDTLVAVPVPLIVHKEVKFNFSGLSRCPANKHGILPQPTSCTDALGLGNGSLSWLEQAYLEDSICSVSEDCQATYGAGFVRRRQKAGPRNCAGFSTLQAVSYTPPKSGQKFPLLYATNVRLRPAKDVIEVVAQCAMQRPFPKHTHHRRIYFPAQLEDHVRVRDEPLQCDHTIHGPVVAAFGEGDSSNAWHYFERCMALFVAALAAISAHGSGPHPLQFVLVSQSLPKSAPPGVERAVSVPAMVLNASIIYLDELPERTCFSRVVWPGLLQQQGSFPFPGTLPIFDDCFSSVTRAYLRSVLRLAGQHLPAMKTETEIRSLPNIIFMARSTQPDNDLWHNMRIIHNQDALVRFLAKKATAMGLPFSAKHWYGGRAVPYWDQVRCLREADILVGVHGAGMAMQMFLRSSAVVVELFPNNVESSLYSGFAQKLGNGYIGVRFSGTAAPLVQVWRHVEAAIALWRAAR
eukprot:TRINITY_DN82993_c0_g1_i1.p1 TRINITY_DN82993_c0_g1~~TRINITY_DN82993_c0_g1_i1.p1  ORF type:complete len:547 (+),score=42.47 TRINITY_DN82993_c0_g1_i1:28-1641(+)